MLEQLAAKVGSYVAKLDYQHAMDRFKDSFDYIGQLYPDKIAPHLSTMSNFCQQVGNECVPIEIYKSTWAPYIILAVAFTLISTIAMAYYMSKDAEKNSR